MAFQPILRHRAAPLAVLTAGLVLYPKRSAYAEALDHVDPRLQRKPIYETSQQVEVTSQDVHATTISPQPPAAPSSTSPSPTDRLAAQVRDMRLFIHGYAVKTEDGVNNLMTRFLHLESSFTSTVASLAPSRESGERLLPGAIYVLVAAMAGSIVTRNRNILLRAAVPLGAGVGASYYVLPETRRNVGNLIWRYEEKFPVVRDNHLRIQEGVRHFIETGKAHSQMGLAMAEEKVEGVNDAVKGWIKQGK